MRPQVAASTPVLGAAGPSSVRELDAQGLDLLALHELAPERYPFLLESVAQGSPRSRYDLLLALPGESLLRDAAGQVHGPHAGAGFLASLDAWFARERTAPGGSLPFVGGWFLYLGYELAAEIETKLQLRTDPRLPVAAAVRVRAAVLRDHATGRVFAVAEPGVSGALEQIARDVAQARAQPKPARGALLRDGLQEDDESGYLEAVDRARRYIREGDIFQANLARRWRGRTAAGVDAATLYARLRDRNPAPFAGLARLGAATIVSSSPERLVEVRGDAVATRPIAGTRRRDPDPLRDAAMRAELIAHPKERAEHVMLIDLERNDLSRICLPGTVKVSELMAIESYATVHHIVSNVVGRRRPEATPGQVIAAVFPGGTITGCPKVRCMEVIAELEGAARGPYTGSMGYLDRSGDLDLNILIRSLLLVGEDVEFQAGAGIVADSVPERELAETRHKARGLTRALEDA
jgi:anthranilate synthase component 1